MEEFVPNQEEENGDTKQDITDQPHEVNNQV